VGSAVHCHDHTGAAGLHGSKRTTAAGAEPAAAGPAIPNGASSGARSHGQSSRTDNTDNTDNTDGTDGTDGHCWPALTANGAAVTTSRAAELDEYAAARR